MPGIIYKITSGKREGQIASVSNKQEQQILSAGKLHAFFYDEKHRPIVRDGKHENGLISPDKLEHCGFFD